MPCRVQDLLVRRFRSYGEDVAQDALVSWLDPEWDELSIRRTYANAPVDARLWLTSWPYLYLGRNAVRREYRNAREQPWSEPPNAPDSGDDDPTFAGRVVSALDRVRLLDAVGYAMLVEWMRGELDVASWKRQLSCSDATVTDRKFLAIYRYAVLFFGVLDQLEPRARAALKARRFAPGDPTDNAALVSARLALRHSAMTLPEFRELYRSAAVSSLDLLARHDALGEESTRRYGDAFRRVLRIDGR
jgi:hypothetical protein